MVSHTHHHAEMLTHSLIFVFLHLSPGQLDSASCTGEGTLDHLEGTLLKMLFKLHSFQILHGTFIWTFHGEHLTQWVMLLSDDIKIVTVATMLTHVQSFTAVAQYVILHCKAMNMLTAAEGTAEKDKTALSYHGVKVFL